MLLYHAVHVVLLRRCAVDRGQPHHLPDLGDDGLELREPLERQVVVVVRPGAPTKLDTTSDFKPQSASGKPINRHRVELSTRRV